jgi:hypothetical protein
LKFRQTNKILLLPVIKNIRIPAALLKSYFKKKKKGREKQNISNFMFDQATQKTTEI